MLVAPPLADDPEQPAREVLEAEPVLSLLVERQPRDGIHGSAEQVEPPAVAKVEATEARREIHDAAAAGGAGLRGHRHREELHDLAPARVRQHPPSIRIRGLEHQAGLTMVHRLAGVEGECRGGGLPRVAAQLRCVQAEWILGEGLAECVQHEARADRPIPSQACVQRGARGPAVLAKTVGLEAAQVHVRIEALAGGAKVGADADQAVCTGAQGRSHARIVATGRGIRLYHATGGVAVEARGRSAQHLDAVQRLQGQVGHLSLAVGHGDGHAVQQQAHAADAERRTRAEPTNRDLQVLGMILPFPRQHTRDAMQGIGKVDARSGFDRGPDLAHGHRGGRGEERPWLA